MKAAPFTYHAPESLDELMGLLPGIENARLLAGGQSLMPMLNMRYATPDHLVDLNGVAALSGIHDRGDVLEIGSMTRQAALADAMASSFPVLAEALAHVGHFQTRNRGTIGGSLCHLDPSAELPCVAAAVGARLVVRGPDGAREAAMADWPVSYMTPDLRENEVLTAIRIPKHGVLEGQAFEEFARRHGDFAIVGVAAMISLDGGRVKRAAVAVAGACPTPVRLSEIETALEGEAVDGTAFGEAAARAAEIDAMDDAYVSASYRRRLTGVLVERALVRAAERAEAVA